MPDKYNQTTDIFEIIERQNIEEDIKREPEQNDDNTGCDHDYRVQHVDEYVYTLTCRKCSHMKEIKKYDYERIFGSLDEWLMEQSQNRTQN